MLVLYSSFSAPHRHYNFLQLHSITTIFFFTSTQHTNAIGNWTPSSLVLAIIWLCESRQLLHGIICLVQFLTSDLPRPCAVLFCHAQIFIPTRLLTVLAQCRIIYMAVYPDILQDFWLCQPIVFIQLTQLPWLNLNSYMMIFGLHSHIHFRKSPQPY